MKKLLFIILFMLLTNMSIAQTVNQHELKSFDDRLRVIEMYKNNLDEKFQNKSESLLIKIDKMEHNLHKEYNYLENTLYYLGGGVILLFFGLFKYVNITAKKKIDETFDSLFENEKDKLIQLIDSQIFENNLRKNKKILIVTEANDNDDFIRLFFLKMKFSNIDYASANIDENIPSNIDLVFINNESNKISEQIIKSYIDRMQNKLVFHFGTKKIDQNWIASNKVVIANSRVQLYGNLINALKYMDIIQNHA